jgi:hypothetical protein
MMKKTTRDSFFFEQMLQKLSGRGREGVMGGVATWEASPFAEDDDRETAGAGAGVKKQAGDAAAWRKSCREEEAVIFRSVLSGWEGPTGLGLWGRGRSEVAASLLVRQLLGA